MKRQNNIEKQIENYKVRTNANADENILNELLKKQSSNKNSPPQTSGSNIWRIIMKNKLTKLAAVFALIIAVFGGLSLLGIIGRGNIAMADVQSAFLSQSWVHLEYDNGTESWYNLKKGDHCHKQLYSYGDSYVYINQTDNLRQRYTPKHGQYISEDRPTIYKGNVIPPYEPKTSWDTIVGPWETTAKMGGSEYCEVEIKSDVLNGRDVIRFDIYHIDVLGSKLLTKQLWADPLTKLPIQIKEKLTAQKQKDQNREYIIGIFSFPQTGPMSIYDWDIPTDLPIVRAYDKTINPFIEESIKQAKQYYDNFPKRCRAVIWQNDSESEIEIIWRDGEKVRFNHYFNLSGEQYTQYHLGLPTTVDNILRWSKTQPPIEIDMDDGNKNYSRRYHPAFENLKTPKIRITRSFPRGLALEAQFIENQWSYTKLDLKRFILIDDAPENLAGYIGIKTESGDIRRDYYIDPEHDYILVHNIWWKLRDGKWEKVREYIVTELSQFTDGQWFISKKRLITYKNPERGTSGSEYNYNIDITLLEQEEFPPDTFNGEKLLEGAEIENY